VALEFLPIRDLIVLPVSQYELLLLFSAVYVALSAWPFVARRDAVARLAGQVRGVVSQRFGTAAEPQYAG